MTLHDKQEEMQLSLLWSKVADKTLEIDRRLFLSDFLKKMCFQFMMLL